jgi:O-antigen ligase
MIVLAGVVLVPLTLDLKGLDIFRLPKEIAFLFVSIALLALLGIGAVLGHLRHADLPPYWQLYVVILGWVTLCTVTSDRPLLSVRSLLMTAGGLALAAVVSSVGRDKPLHWLGVLLVPAIINGVLYAAQEFNLWNPFMTREQFAVFIGASGRDAAAEIHGMSIGLQGNPTDVAGLFLPPALTLFALALVFRGRRRLAALAGAIVLFALVVSTQILTATIALLAGVAAAAFSATNGKMRIAVIVGVLGGAAAITASGPVRAKINQNLSELAHHRYDRILTGRMPPFVAALEMAREHKFLGVGPGCFAYRYLDYRLKAEQTRPWLPNSPAGEVNFGEVHCDHLQIAAEEGIPGYVLFLISLGVIAAGSFRRATTEPEKPDLRRRFSQIASLPIAVCFAVLATMQFPLELPAIVIGFIYLAALSISWREADEGA